MAVEVHDGLSGGGATVHADVVSVGSGVGPDEGLGAGQVSRLIVSPFIKLR